MQHTKPIRELPAYLGEQGLAADEIDEDSKDEGSN